MHDVTVLCMGRRPIQSEKHTNGFNVTEHKTLIDVVPDSTRQWASKKPTVVKF